MNENDIGDAVAALVSTSDKLSPERTVPTVAVDNEIAVAAMFIEPAI